jgi:hypothetical protein
MNAQGRFQSTEESEMQKARQPDVEGKRTKLSSQMDTRQRQQAGHEEK